MFQTLVSYVNKVRLGGKSYAPTADHPFSVYNKQLGELVDFVDRLQSRLVLTTWLKGQFLAHVVIKPYFTHVL